MTQPANIQQLLGQMNQMAAAMRVQEANIQALRGQLQNAASATQIAAHLGNLASGVKVEGSSGPRGGGGGDWMAQRTLARAWGGAGYVSLADIQGRLIPFEQFETINIPGNSSGQLATVMKISMEGPMVATHRYAVLESRVQFQVTYANGTTEVFAGRTNGRQRPVSSVGDLFDAAHAFEQINQYQPSYLGGVWDGTSFVAVGNPAGVNPSSNAQSTPNMPPPFPGTGRPLVVSPLSMSSGRSMVFDGHIMVEPQGAQFKRSNRPVPSAQWSEGINKAVPLSCYDVFEPGEDIQLTVIPSHTNNPPLGNIQKLIGLGALANMTMVPGTGVASGNPAPVGAWPFLAGQFDGHEGINDETRLGDGTTVTIDRVVRVFDAVLHLGFRGFRIIAAPGK